MLYNYEILYNLFFIPLFVRCYLKFKIIKSLFRKLFLVYFYLILILKQRQL